ncbi:hypothetical protein [Dokdonella sp.]|uniref:hypothetical protein n=1 Tax=Dokdonella sp. TaxID=2291710 RepID=UPI002F42B39A
MIAFNLIPRLGVVPMLLCASCASLQGAWYYQTPDQARSDRIAATQDGSKNNIARDAESGAESGRGVAETCDDARLYFAVANDTSKPLIVTKVEINDANAGDVGWICEGRQSVRRGQLLVLKLPIDGQARCALPRRAWLSQGESGERKRISVAAGMPSALPRVWLQCPVAFARSCGGGSETQEPLPCHVLPPVEDKAQ